MSYTMPGMQVIPYTPDMPSGVTDIPSAYTGGGAGIHTNVAYSGSLDVNGAIILFVVLYFGTVGALHYISHRNGLV